METGDVVMLKSGGPKMTVMPMRRNNSTQAYPIDVGYTDPVPCAWFAPDGQVHTTVFPAAALNKLAP